MVRKLILALAAPLLLAGACANQADETQVLTGAAAVSALQAAPDAAVEAGSGRFEMTIALDGPDGAFEIVSTGGYSGDRMSMEMDLGSALAGLAEGSGESIPAGLDEPMQIVVDGGTAYVRIPMLQALTGGTGWVSATPEELGAAGGSLGLSGGTTDPSQLLEVLRGVADDVEEAGQDEVRGVPTTRYRATVDVATAIERAPAAQRDELAAALQELGADAEAIPVEVWVDGDGLARRLVMDFGQLVAQAMGGTGTATMTLELFDYGEDVDIQVPRASETTPLREAFGAFGGLEGKG
jgi:hypothetical protein